MARVENITGLKAVSTSNSTGKPWSSGASMAAEVSENAQDYSFDGGKQMQNAQIVKEYQTQDNRKKNPKNKNYQKQFYKNKAKRKANTQNKKQNKIEMQCWPE